MSKKSNYQNKYWDDYFLFVKICLRRDGYSDSDGSVETAVRDTFYLEKHDEKDFMEWFVDDESFESAKSRIVELLTEADRKSSNLKLDIKYYTRDLEYFRRFLKAFPEEKED